MYCLCIVTFARTYFHLLSPLLRESVVLEFVPNCRSLPGLVSPPATFVIASTAAHLCSPSPEVLANHIPRSTFQSSSFSLETSLSSIAITKSLLSHIIAVNMSLCKACRAIDPALFSPANDDVHIWGSGKVMHRPVNWIKKSAQSGCTLCKFLVESDIDRCFNQDTLENAPVVLEGGYSLLKILIGNACVAWIECLHVPKIWSTQSLRSVSPVS